MAHDAPPGAPRAGRADDGLVPTALAAGLAAMLAILAAVAHDGMGPSPAIPSWVPLGILYGAPAVIGWLGAVTRRGPLLVAAGVLYLPLAVLAFSGVTLPFLLPALLYLRAAAGHRSPVAASRGLAPSRRRALVILAVSAVSAPIVVWIVLASGLVGVLGLVIAAGLAQGVVPSGRPSEAEPVAAAAAPGGRSRSRLIDGLLVATIVTLVLGAGAAALATTTVHCWIRADTATGPRFRDIALTNSISLGAGETAGGCDSGIYTAGGLALEIALVGSGVGLAAWASRRPAGAGPIAPQPAAS